MVLKKFRIRSFLKMFESRAKHCQRLEFWGLVMNIRRDDAAYFTKLIPTSSSCIEVQKLRDAGLRIRLLQSSQNLRRMLYTDPYSVQRCSNYQDITSHDA